MYKNCLFLINQEEAINFQLFLFIFTLGLHCCIVGIRNRHPLAQQLGTGRRIAAGTAEAARIRILIVNSEDLDVIIVNSGTAAVIIDDKAIWIDMALITLTPAV